MPIEGLIQPDVLEAGEDLRLVRYDGSYGKGWAWYQDAETVLLVDGVRKVYDWDTLRAMYAYLNAHGELYWIEYRESPDVPFRAVGDVTLCREDLPIVLGEPQLRGKGLGRRVLGVLIRRAEDLGWDHLAVREIYGFNPASETCFASMGFRRQSRTERGWSWRLDL